MEKKKHFFIFLVIQIVIISIFTGCQSQVQAEAGNSSSVPDVQIAHQPILYNGTLSASQKAIAIAQLMNDGEQIRFLSGYEGMSLAPFAHLGLKQVVFADSTIGIARSGRATAWPAGTMVAATWNRELARQIGEEVAREALAKGIDVVLGPGVNIYRLPTCGRNFEYSGEDPYLSGELAVSYIQGLQSQKVMATVKHFAANNQEYDRHSLSSNVQETVLQEIYFPAFRKAILEADAASIMMAYNPVNGINASENSYLITDVLRNQWNYQGIVMSDWKSTYSTAAPILAGLDLEMPRDQWLNKTLVDQEIAKGLFTQKLITEKVVRILTKMIEYGVYTRDLSKPVSDDMLKKHNESVLQAAAEGTVLLKNDGLLPLTSDVNSIVVMGPNALNTETGGGGASFVTPQEKSNLVDSLKHEFQNAEIVVIQEKRKLSSSDKTLIKNADTVFYAAGFDHIIEQEGLERYWELPKKQINRISQISALNSNVAVLLFAGGGVQTTHWLKDCSALLHCFYPGQSGTDSIAGIISGRINPSGKLPFTMAKKWNDFKASEFYIENDDFVKWRLWCFPDGDRSRRPIGNLEYGENLAIGYRHFDTAKIEPAFSFGFGLSYTEFTIGIPTISAHLKNYAVNRGEGYSDKVSPGTISVQVTNKGPLEGKETVQLYLTPPNGGSLDDNKLLRPIQELKAFQKLALSAGESQVVELTLDSYSFKQFNQTNHRWEIIPGTWLVRIGNSSRSIVQSIELEI